MRIKALIAGVYGKSLTAEDLVFFKDNPPWGYILVARNVEEPAQLLSLTDELRALSGRPDVPILIDQEGGRVARLRPPHWPSYPPGRVLGQIYHRNAEAGLRAAFLQSRLIALDLAKVGVNVDCLPVLDVPVEGAHDVIGDRAYSYQPYEVATIARAACDGLLAGGVLPIIKHIPGHGRAFADSHKELPVVDTSPCVLACTDFYPFMQLSGMPMAMTAHVVYSALDPENPATNSPILIGRIIRGWIGFDGLLMSDDLSMQALSGDFAHRTHSAFAAGCDVVLHCNGVMEEMREIASACPELDGEAARRARAAMNWLRKPEPADEVALRKEFEGLALAVA